MIITYILTYFFTHIAKTLKCTIHLFSQNDNDSVFLLIDGHPIIEYPKLNMNNIPARQQRTKKGPAVVTSLV